MILKCLNCGTSYNNLTVAECPACNPHYYRSQYSEIDSFLREQNKAKSKVVASYRNSCLSIWSTQHLQDRKEFHAN